MPVPLAPSLPLPPLPPAAPPARAEEKSQDSAFGWLRRDKAKVPSLAQLLATGTSRTGEAAEDVNFIRAVASELRYDAISGSFDGYPELKSVPSSVPESTRTFLLHGVVKSEAEALKPTQRAEAIVSVARAMGKQLLESAAEQKEKTMRIEALENLVLFVRSVEQLCAELAPDVEFGKVVYEGDLKYRKLEELFGEYVESSVQEMQSITTSMLSSLMSGSQEVGQDPNQAAKIQAKIEQGDKRRQTMAEVLGISEGKAEKILEKKVEEVAKAAQKDLLSGLPKI